MVSYKKLNLLLVLTLILSLVCQTSFAQGDFIILKKKNKSIQRIFTGDNFSFSTKSGSFYNGLVYATRNDSIIIQEFVIKKMPTTLGTYILDTLGSMKYSFHYKDIYSIGQPKNKGFNLFASGSSLIGGSILLIVGSGVVYVADRKKFSPELLIGSAVLGGVGYLLTKAGSKGIIIGKRGYSIQYIHI